MRLRGSFRCYRVRGFTSAAAASSTYVDKCFMLITAIMTCIFLGSSFQIAEMGSPLVARAAVPLCTAAVPLCTAALAAQNSSRPTSTFSSVAQAFDTAHTLKSLQSAATGTTLLKKYTGAFASETVLRGLSVTFEELAVVHATGLTQDQLHTARVFSIADANFLRAEATGAAWCSVMLARAPKSARAVVARAAAIALSAGLRKSYQLEEDPSLDVGAYVDEVALAAARAMAAGKSEAEAEADGFAKFEEIYWAPSEARQSACAAAALMSTCNESMRAAFSELIAPYSLDSVEAGRKSTAHIALRVAPREHAWTAQWDLEYHARDLFGGSTEYACVMSMVGAFRQAYSIVYKSKPTHSSSTAALPASGQGAVADCSTTASAARASCKGCWQLAEGCTASPVSLLASR